MVSELVTSQGGDAALQHVEERLEGMFAEPAIGPYERLVAGPGALRELERLLAAG